MRIFLALIVAAVVVIALVGLMPWRNDARTARALSACINQTEGLPLAAVDHLQGHVAANFLKSDGERFEPPFLCLIASGGHTLLTRVQERDGFDVLGPGGSTPTHTATG